MRKHTTNERHQVLEHDIVRMQYNTNLCTIGYFVVVIDVHIKTSLN
jgi:hypothetical protein